MIPFSLLTIVSPLNRPDRSATSQRERSFFCLQHVACATLTRAVSVVSVADAFSANEALCPLSRPSGRPILPPPSFSVWSRPIHLQLSLPYRLCPPSISNSPH